MEGALRSVIKSMFDDYVYNLDKKIDASSFPVTLRDLTLKNQTVNEDLQDTPFELTEGRIREVTLNAGWLGNLDVTATGITLKLDFSAPKAARLLTQKGQEVPDDDIFLTGGMAEPEPPPNVPPRFCQDHDTSAKRPKREPYMQTCMNCGTSMQTSYCDVSLCPPCSEKIKCCMICKKPAQRAGTYMPPQELGGKPLMGRPDAGPPPGPGGPPGMQGGPPSNGMPMKEGSMNAPGGPGRNPNSNGPPPAPGQGQFPRGSSNGTLPPSASNYGVGIETGGRSGGQRMGYPGGPGGMQGGPPNRGPPGPRGPPQRRPPPEDDDDSIMGFFKWLIPAGGSCGHPPVLDADERRNYDMQAGQQRQPRPPQTAYVGGR